MKTTILLTFAAASIHAFIAPIEVHDLLTQASDMVNQPRTETQGCWKPIFHREPDALQCQNGMDLSGDACYPACESGFQAFGPYCVRSTAAQQQQMVMGGDVQRQTYLRTKVQAACDGDVIDGQCLNTCPAETMSMGSICVTSECPGSLPFTCGIFCTKNAGVCTKEVSELSTIGFKIVVDIQAGNWIGAIAGLKKLIDVLKSFPPCSDIESQSQKEAVAQIMKLAQTFQHKA